MTATYTTPDTYTFPRTLRTTLPFPLWTGDCIPVNEWQTGVYLTGVYWQPRAKRLILRTVSIWSDNKGRSIGETYREAELAEYGRVAGHHWSIEEQMTKAGLLPWILNSI